MQLTEEELRDFHADIGISDDQSVFTDAELQRLYVRSNGNYRKAVILAIKQILADATKLTNYKVGQVQEGQDKVFEHLKDLLDILNKEYNNEVRTPVRIFGISPIPPAEREIPYDQYDSHNSYKRSRYDRRRWSR